MIEQKTTRDELIYLINNLPENETMTAKKFLEFLIAQARVPFQSDVEKEKITVLEELCGICAGCPGGSEEFMREKQEDLDREEQKLKERLS
ncbi:MAG TPA: hypothetical protein PL110_13775 [Candidatus Eremiobacteraeota bacterium]|nr:hypothetical protein [Candidatus Eremiobacteraeota bacterium]